MTHPTDVLLQAAALAYTQGRMDQLLCNTADTKADCEAGWKRMETELKTRLGVMTDEN